MGAHALTIDTARVIAATVAAPRFHGRAALLRIAAETHRPELSAQALRCLELSQRAREIAALRGEWNPVILRALDLDCVREQRRVRDERAQRARITRSDPLATRTPGLVPRRASERALRLALHAAQFRAATHSHSDTILFVPRGQECASSDTGTLWACDAGLPAAYLAHSYSVTTSAHVWRVSADIFAVAPERRWDGRCLYLSPSVRVRQGRGTSLVCEHRVGTKWEVRS